MRRPTVLLAALALALAAGAPAARATPATAAPVAPPARAAATATPARDGGAVSRTSAAATPAAAPAALPPHALVGYLHASFGNGSGYVPISRVPDSWDVIDLAFGEPTSATSGRIEFTRCAASECPGRESDADFLAGIDAKRAAGKVVLLSIGGANGEVRLTTTAARDAFVDSVSAIIDRWHLDGVDLDFENQSLSLDTGDTDFTRPTTPAIVNLVDAVRALKSRYGSGFVLTAAPETFFVQLGYQHYGAGPSGAQDPRSGAWLPVLYALRDDLTLLTVQDYNSGPVMGLDDQYHTMGGADFHIAMTDMLLAGFPVAGATTVFPPLRPDQVAIGAPANAYAGNGYVPPAALDQALDCLTKGASCGGYVPRGGTHPDLRGLMAWSINWDGYGGGEFAATFDAYFG